MNPVETLLLRHIAAGQGGRTALVDHERAVTYAELTQAAHDHAGALAAAGARRGCRALVVGDDNADTVVAVLGLWWYGCVPVVLSPMLRDAEIAFVARDCAAEYAAVSLPEERRDSLREALRPLPVRELGATRAADAGPPAPFAPDAEALVQYTSGSTGQPRGVRHSMAGLPAVLDGFGSVLALTPDDTVLSTAKLSFGYGFGNSVLFPLAAGARSVLLAGPVDPYTAITAIHRHRPTVLCAVPRLYAALLDTVARGTVLDPSSLRLALAAGEHLPAELSARAARSLGVPVVNGLGATEVLHIVLATDPQAPVHGSTGNPVPGVTATVRDDNGRPLPAGRGAGAGGGVTDREPTAHRGGGPPGPARPSWGGRRMSAPCNATSTGSASPVRPRPCRWYSAGSRLSGPTSCGPATRCTARRSPAARPTCSPSWTTTAAPWPGTDGAMPKTPFGWPPRCAPPWPVAGSRKGSMWTTARRSWTPGCCAPAPNWGSSWCTPHLAARRGRGKIERFFRTIREQFLVEITGDPTSPTGTTWPTWRS